MSTGSCLAVDFGTTNTVAVITSLNGQRGDAPLQRVKFGNDWRLPSAVFWNGAGPPTVGVNAERSQRLDPDRFVRCPKRDLGYGSVVLAGAAVPVVDVVAAVLATVHQEARQQLGGEPQRVVLTRPVEWAARRRAEFEAAAHAAGFSEGQFLEEPVAASIRLGSLAGLPSGSPFAVLDFGGGTLDVAVVQRNGGAFDVVASEGADPLGGEDIDDLVFTYVLGMLADQEMARSLAESSDPVWDRHRTALRINCRFAKEQVSEQDHGVVGIPPTGEDVVLTRQQFDDLTEPVMQRVTGTVRETVLQSGFEPATVPVYLVGGSSRIPTLARMVESQLGCEVRAVGDEQFVVSEGAALWAAGGPGAERGRMLFERLRERYPGRATATEETSHRAAETLRLAGERARVAGARVREAAERAKVPAGVKETGGRVRQETLRIVDDVRTNPKQAHRHAAVLGVALAVLVLIVIIIAAVA